MAFEPSREEQLSEERLKFGYWWVTHRAQARRGFIAFLIFLDLILVGYAAYGFLDWYFLSGVRERAEIALLTRNLTDYSAFREARAPRPLAFDDPVVLPSGTDGQDVFAVVTNPNLRWWAEFDHQFAVPGAEVPSRRSYILPGDTRFVRELGISAPRAGSPSFAIANIVWRRVDPHVIRPDLATWARARLNFAVSDARFRPPAPDDPLKVSRATFNVKNDTAFGYWRVSFFVILWSGSSIVGANSVTISDLRPGETREVAVSWFNEIHGVTRVEVVPEVNIFDDRVYIPPGR